MQEACVVSHATLRPSEIGRAENPELLNTIAILPVLCAAIAGLVFGAAFYLVAPSKRLTLGAAGRLDFPSGVGLLGSFRAQ